MIRVYFYIQEGSRCFCPAALIPRHWYIFKRAILARRTTFKKLILLIPYFFLGNFSSSSLVAVINKNNFSTEIKTKNHVLNILEEPKTQRVTKFLCSNVLFYFLWCRLRISLNKKIYQFFSKLKNNF